MGINITAKSELEAEDPKNLQAHEVREWIRQVPDGATITPITHDFGNQRDPWVVLTGLRATWSEVRHVAGDGGE